MAQSEFERAVGVLSWQAEFDRWFPFGATCTAWTVSPEVADAEFICPRVIVESEDPLQLRLSGIEKTAWVEVERIEDYDVRDTRFIDKLIYQEDPEASSWRLTNRLGEDVRVFTAQQRQDVPWLYEGPTP